MILSPVHFGTATLKKDPSVRNVRLAKGQAGSASFMDDMVDNILSIRKVRALARQLDDRFTLIFGTHSQPTTDYVHVLFNDRVYPTMFQVDQKHDKQRPGFSELPHELLIRALKEALAFQQDVLMPQPDFQSRGIQVSQSRFNRKRPPSGLSPD